jgi:hypothetical protein
MASDHYKDDRSIDRHIWPKYGIPLPLWLYIASASSDRKSHTVMLSGYSLQVDACMVTTNVGSFNFVIEDFFSSLKVNSIQNGRPITTIQTSTIDMKNTTKYCFESEKDGKRSLQR